MLEHVRIDLNSEGHKRTYQDNTARCPDKSIDNSNNDDNNDILQRNMAKVRCFRMPAQQGLGKLHDSGLALNHRENEWKFRVEV